MEKILDINIVIQPFRKEHEKEVVELIVGIQQNEFDIPITASDQPDLMEIPNFYQTGCGNFWVATNGNRIVGTIGLLDIGDQKAALRKMFVDSSFRGNETGTAHKLLETLISWSQRHGINTIYLGTTPQFLAAHRFYEKNGFTEIQKKDLPGSFPVMEVDKKFYKLEI